MITIFCIWIFILKIHYSYRGGRKKSATVKKLYDNDEQTGRGAQLGAMQISICIVSFYTKEG